jgi:hypothetical protein
MAGYLALGESLYEQTSINTACANYYFPYTNVELQVNPDPYPETNPVNTAVLDNVYDPCFVKLSKSTDKKEKWGVLYYYSAILMSPSVYQNDRVYLKWDDTTSFQFVKNTPGYITCGQEGQPPYDIGQIEFDPTYQDRSGQCQVISGPQLYSDSVPDVATTHNSKTVSIYYPNANKVTNRVKVALQTPNNWHQVQKFDGMVS